MQLCIFKVHFKNYKVFYTNPVLSIKQPNLRIKKMSNRVKDRKRRIFVILINPFTPEIRRKKIKMKGKFHGGSVESGGNRP